MSSMVMVKISKVLLYDRNSLIYSCILLIMGRKILFVMKFTITNEQTHTGKISQNQY